MNTSPADCDCERDDDGDVMTCAACREGRDDDGAEDPAAGGAYAGAVYAAAPLDEQVDDADVIPFP